MGPGGPLKAPAELPWWRSGEECLPMQEVRAGPLVGDDPTCCGAAEPVCHNY